VNVEKMALETSHEDLENFIILDKVRQEEMLFLVSQSKTFDLPQEKLKAYISAIKQVDNPEMREPLKELIALFKNLPAQEKQILTPRIYRSLDELTKLQLLHLVRENATNLTTEERSKILSPQFRYLHKEGDLERLSAQERSELKALLIRKFNELPSKVKKEM